MVCRALNSQKWWFPAVDPYNPFLSREEQQRHATRQHLLLLEPAPLPT
jgi:hypothetical protein